MLGVSICLLSKDRSLQEGIAVRFRDVNPRKSAGHALIISEVI
jgi:hypothetical protein